MSEIPEAEFRAMFAEFLCNPVAYRALADRMMTEEAIASAGLAGASPVQPPTILPQCVHGYYHSAQNCPQCGWK